MTYVIPIFCQMSLKKHNLIISNFSIEMGFEKAIKYVFGTILVAGLGYASGVGIITLSETVLPVSKQKNLESKIVSAKNESIYKIAQVIYGEAANQPEIAREAAAKTILNRIGKPGYDSDIIKVINKKNAFSCMNSSGSKNWRQATGKLEMNDYEKMIFKRCLQDAKDVLNGKRLGYKNEDKWVAYFDKTVFYEDLLKKNPRYWKTVKPDAEIGAFTFCVIRD